MFCIDDYIKILTNKLQETFKERLLYIGLQGSYLRGEAKDSSDIDIMAVIDGLSVEDLKSYKNVLEAVGYYERSCGFICSKADLKSWNPLEICHLLNTTKDYYGRLKALVPKYTLEDERNYVKLSLNNLYHELCHRYIHSSKVNNISKLPLTCKSVFFILQNLHYIESGNFVATKSELLQCLSGKGRDVLELSISLQNKPEYDFDKAFSLIFSWCQETLSRV